MKSVKTWYYHHLTQLRRIMQSAMLVVLIALPLLNKAGVHWLSGTLYSLRTGPVPIADPAMALQTFLLNRAIISELLIAVLLPAVLALALGRVFCSWLCPFDLLAAGLLKFRKPQNRNGDGPRNRNPRARKYWLVFAALLLLIVISGVPLVVFLSMPGLISSQISDALFWGVIGIEASLIPAALLLEFFSGRRIWCKYICPVGAALALFRSPLTLKVDFQKQRCTCSPNHLPCNVACPLHLDPRRAGIYPYCYNCGDCINRCMGEGRALSFSFTSKDVNQKSYARSLV
ncbi:MAG: 4Fe-4S binding protein [Calditrichia bacterium]